MSCGKHLRENRKGNVKKLNIGLFSFLSVALVFFVMINFNNIIGYFQSLVEKTNDISVEPYYTVTFDANGGTGVMAEQKISYNVATTLNKNTFEKTGYTFKNWDTKKEIAPHFLKRK